MNPNENRHSLESVVNAVRHTPGARLGAAVAEFLKKDGIPFANSHDELTKLPLRLKMKEDKTITVCPQPAHPDALPYLERAGEHALAIHKAISYALGHTSAGIQHKLVLHYLEVNFGLQNRQLVITEPFNLNTLDIAPRDGPRVKKEEVLIEVFNSRTPRSTPRNRAA